MEGQEYGATDDGDDEVSYDYENPVEIEAIRHHLLILLKRNGYECFSDGPIHHDGDGHLRCLVEVRDPRQLVSTGWFWWKKIFNISFIFKQMVYNKFNESLFNSLCFIFVYCSIH